MVACYHTTGKLGTQVLALIDQMRTFLGTKSALEAALQLLEQPRDDRLRRRLKLRDQREAAGGSDAQKKAPPPMLELVDVSFSYVLPGGSLHHIIKGATVSLSRGSKTAIVGRSGIGKSTMSKILSRLYQPTWGVILIDGQDINELRAGDVASDIAFIEQSFVLFDGSVKENILYGLPRETASAAASTGAAVSAAGDAGGDKLTAREESELQAAIDAACLRDDVESRFANGIDTNVGAGGKALSRGQQQRVAIARAWIRHAKILLADEPVSGQDPENAMALMTSMRDMTDQRGESAVSTLGSELTYLAAAC